MADDEPDMFTSQVEITVTAHATHPEGAVLPEAETEE